MFAVETALLNILKSIRIWVYSYTVHNGYVPCINIFTEFFTEVHHMLLPTEIVLFEKLHLS